MAGKLDTNKMRQKAFTSAPLDTTFVLRASKAIDKISIGTHQTALLGGIAPTSVNREAMEMSFVIAALSTVLIDPRDFDFSTVEDEDTLFELYKEWREWNLSFRPTPVAIVE